MSKFFTVITAVDKSGYGKSYHSGQGKTEEKSVAKAIKNYTAYNIDGDDTILAIRTYDDISNVGLKALHV